MLTSQGWFYAPTLLRGKFMRCVNMHPNPSGPFCPACVIAMSRSVPALKFSSTRWKCISGWQKHHLWRYERHAERICPPPVQYGMFAPAYALPISHLPNPAREMDVECFVCGGKGCSVCKGSGWLEIMGCGMMHPTVLKMVDMIPSLFRFCRRHGTGTHQHALT